MHLRCRQTCCLLLTVHACVQPIGLVVPRALPALPAFSMTLASGTKAIATILPLGCHSIPPDRIAQIRRFHNSMCSLSAPKAKAGGAAATSPEQPKHGGLVPAAKRQKTQVLVTADMLTAAAVHRAAALGIAPTMTADVDAAASVQASGLSTAAAPPASWTPQPALAAASSALRPTPAPASSSLQPVPAPASSAPPTAPAVSQEAVVAALQAAALTSGLVSHLNRGADSNVPPSPLPETEYLQAPQSSNAPALAACRTLLAQLQAQPASAASALAQQMCTEVMNSLSPAPCSELGRIAAARAQQMDTKAEAAGAGKGPSVEVPTANGHCENVSTSGADLQAASAALPDTNGADLQPAATTLSTANGHDSTAKQPEREVVNNLSQAAASPRTPASQTATVQQVPAQDTFLSSPAKKRRASGTMLRLKDTGLGAVSVTPGTALKLQPATMKLQPAALASPPSSETPIQLLPSASISHKPPKTIVSFATTPTVHNLQTWQPQMFRQHL